MKNKQRIGKLEASRLQLPSRDEATVSWQPIISSVRSAVTECVLEVEKYFRFRVGWKIFE